MIFQQNAWHCLGKNCSHLQKTQIDNLWEVPKTRSILKPLDSVFQTQKRRFQSIQYRVSSRNSSYHCFFKCWQNNKIWIKFKNKKTPNYFLRRNFFSTFFVFFVSFSYFPKLLKENRRKRFPNSITKHGFRASNRSSCRKWLKWIWKEISPYSLVGQHGLRRSTRDRGRHFG